MSSAATIFETVGGIVTPDILIANTLTVQVVPEPSTWLLSIGLLAILALASTQRRAAGFIRHGSGPQRTIPTRARRRNHCLYGIQRTFLDFS